MEDKTYIIDVREPHEFALGHISGAINVSSESLMTGASELKNIPKDASLIVYCRSGSRSDLAIQIFREMGFKNLTNGINKQTVAQKFGLS